MALILSIDTSQQNAALALANGGQVLERAENALQNDHAAWIHTAISHLFNKAGKTLQQLDAVAVSSGPGSYTGLRVGMATAKGLCFALGLPLITENTLKLTAFRAKTTLKPAMDGKSMLICPMIDARRMEVFTALYDHTLDLVMPPLAMILHEHSFSEQLEQQTVLFCGNGAAKWQEICRNNHAVFSGICHTIDELVAVAAEKYKNGLFSDLAYTEPDYFKNAYVLK